MTRRRSEQGRASPQSSARDSWPWPRQLRRPRSASAPRGASGLATRARKLTTADEFSFESSGVDPRRHRRRPTSTPLRRHRRQRETGASRRGNPTSKASTGQHRVQRRRRRRVFTMSRRSSVREVGLQDHDGVCCWRRSTFVAGASAATYEVHACRLPSGAPAPAHGWTTVTRSPGAASQINCPGGAMTSQPRRRPAQRGHPLRILVHSSGGHDHRGLRATCRGRRRRRCRAAHLRGTGSTASSERSSVVTRPLALAACSNCGVFTRSWLIPSIAPRLTRRSTRRFSAGRRRPYPCQANGSRILPFAGSPFGWRTSRLLKWSAPQVRSSTKEPAARASGSSHSKFRDVGGGLLKTRVEVDGQRFAEQRVDDNAGRCTRTVRRPGSLQALGGRGTAGRHDPHCPTESISFSVRVFDATGVNSRCTARSITVDNVPDSAGPRQADLPAASDGKLTRRLGTKTTRFGGMASVTGRISRNPASGDPRGAGGSYRGAHATARSARVGRSGRFRLRLRLESRSSCARFSWRASGLRSCAAPDPPQGARRYTVRRRTEATRQRRDDHA